MGSLTAKDGKYIASMTITGEAFEELEYYINNCRWQAGMEKLSKEDVVDWINHHFGIVMDVAFFGTVETAIRERLYEFIVEGKDSEEFIDYSPENKLIVIDDYVYIVRAELKPELFKALQKTLNDALAVYDVPSYDDSSTLHWLNKHWHFHDTVATMLLFQDPDYYYLNDWIKEKIDKDMELFT